MVPSSDADASHVTMRVPNELAPMVAQLLAQHRAGGAMPPLGTLAYAGDGPRRPWTSVSMTLLLGFNAALWTGVVLFVVPKFETIFRDFHAELPALTQLLLSLSRRMGTPVGLAVMWVLALGLPVAITRLRRWPPNTRSLDTTVIVVCVLALMLTVVFCIAALFAPMLALIQTISGPGR